MISFVRLTEIEPSQIAEHMSDPKVARHLPLLDKTEWSEADALSFVKTKEDCWHRDGLGHWAILIDGQYAGWGGFQKEEDEWDFGLVLRSDYFGQGLQIASEAIKIAETDPGIPFVTFLLPSSRKNLSALRRLGADRIGIIQYGEAEFYKFRLNTT